MAGPAPARACSSGRPARSATPGRRHRTHSAARRTPRRRRPRSRSRRFATSGSPSPERVRPAVRRVRRRRPRLRPLRLLWRAAARPDCLALLFATANGGRSWHRISHPRPMARNSASRSRPTCRSSMSPVTVGTSPWDDGSSYQREVSPPSVVRALRSWIQVDERTGKVIGWEAGVWRPLPVQPPLSRPQSVYGSDGLVVAASVADGRPLLAVSFDSGAHSRRPRCRPRTARSRRSGWRRRFAGDVWLIGERRGRRPPARPLALRRRVAAGAGRPVPGALRVAGALRRESSGR